MPHQPFWTAADSSGGRLICVRRYWLDHVVSNGYPRLLEDRDVLVVRGDEQKRALVRGWLDGYDGPLPRYRIELFLGKDLYTATAMDMFEALVRLRRQLEPKGWMVAVQGSRRDTYPSGMGRDVGGGRRIYVMRMGRAATSSDLVDTLADAALDQLATIAEQEAYRDTWHAAPKHRP